MKMQQSSSIIDMLRNLHEQQMHAQPQSQYLNLTKCDSQQLTALPIPKHLSSTHPLPISSLSTQQKQPNTEVKRSLFLNINNPSPRVNYSAFMNQTNFHNKEMSRNDEVLFQIKLKLASFVARFNIDDLCLVNVREQSVESMLDLVFKKFKEFKKQHENMMKACNESIKFKEIQILNLQSKLSNLQQMMCQQTNKFSRMKQKQLQQQSNLHQHIQSLQSELQNCKKSIYMLQQITKQQNSYIKHLQSEQSQQFSTKLLTLQSEISTMNSKYHMLTNQNKQLKEEMYKVCEENRNINDEILQVMQQNKMYKMEAMKEKENVEKKVAELETMEEKLIAYYEMYMGEVARKEAVEAKNKQLQQQVKNVKNSNAEQLQGIKQVIKKTLLENEALLLQKQASKKELEWLKRDNQVKQTQILKLSKTLSELVHSMNNRPQVKKVRSEIEIPSSNSQSDDRDRYSIRINGSESWRKDKDKSKQKQKQRQRQRQRQIEKEKYKQELQKIQIENEQKTAVIVEDWKLRLQKTVDYYEKYIQKLQSEMEKTKLC